MTGAPIADDRFRNLVERYFPGATDPQALCAALRQEFEIYERDRSRANHNKIHRDIENLHKASERHDVTKTMGRLNALSTEARRYLEIRANQQGVTFPEAGSADLCERIATLCRVGGAWVEGRKRKSAAGVRRSITWEPLLYAPEKTRNFQKREADRLFVISLQLTWLTATGEEPAETADQRKPGPFARFVRDCLDLADAPHVNAVKTINAVAKDRVEMKSRSSQSDLSPIKG